MKNLVLIIVIIFSLFNISFSQNNRLNKILGNGSIFFVDENNGWLFNASHIGKTSDKGNSWEVMLTFDTDKNALYENTKGNDLIYFINSQIGYFITIKYSGITNSTHLYKTTNGGISFTRSTIIGSNFNVDSYAKNLFFIDENTGWFVCNAIELIKTTNSGLTWEKVYSGSLNFDKIHFTDSQNGWAYINNKLYKSTDGGATWTEINVPGSNYIYTITCVDNNIWVGGYNDGIYRSTDNGINWNKVSDNFPSGPQSWSYGYFKMFNSTHGVSNGHITTDGGITWTEKFNRYNFYNNVSLLNINNCWFYDTNGNLCKTNDFFETQETVFHTTTGSIGSLPFGSIEIVSEQVVVAAFQNGGILRSIDGGKTWKFIKDLFTVHQINDISFANSTTGIAVGKNFQAPQNTAYISRTTDAGLTWNIIYQLPGIHNIYDEDIYSVNFSNGKYIALSRGKLLRSSDNGVNWSADSTDLSWGLHQIQFNGNTGYGISAYGSGKLYKSTNNGTGWNLVKDVHCGGLSFISENLVYANFADSQFCKSTDGGNTWTKTGWTPGWNFNRIFFKDNLLGVATGADFSFGEGTFITNNGGNTWTKVSELYNIINGISNGIDFTSSEYGFIASSYGLFTMKSYGTIDSVTSVENEFNINPNNFVLYQNYPNPFNPTTTIEYVIASPDKSGKQSVILKVYDILGNEVATLVNEYKSPGIYKAEWNASGFASGVYYYQLISGNFAHTKKLILIK